VYALTVPFLGEQNVPKVMWSDGTNNTSVYVYQHVNGCGTTDYAAIVPKSQIDPVNDLKVIGAAGDGTKIYGFKDQKHAILIELFDEYQSLLKVWRGTLEQPKPELSYDAFLAERPIFYWIDPFSRLIEFKKDILTQPTECGKPVIYLYPEKTMEVNVQVEPQGGMSYSDPKYDSGWSVIWEEIPINLLGREREEISEE
jgi:hypothetical protein